MFFGTVYKYFLLIIFSIVFLRIYFRFINYSGYQWKDNLRYVRIYFDTPTFDRITKDRAAKFVTILSAIGGTMGLLTGFSIISGIEMIFFCIRQPLHLIKLHSVCPKFHSLFSNLELIHAIQRTSSVFLFIQFLRDFFNE